jgi:hypothetical protein
MRSPKNPASRPAQRAANTARRATTINHSTSRIVNRNMCAGAYLPIAMSSLVPGCLSVPFDQIRNVDLRLSMIL